MNKIVLALLLTAVFAVPAFSQMSMSMNDHHEGHGQKMGMGAMDSMMGMCLQHADKLGLTDDQVMKMKPVHREMQKKEARFKADEKIAQIECMEIMEVKDFDLEKARTAVEKSARITTGHHVEMLIAMKKMRSILTDDQFQQMKKMMARHTEENKAEHTSMKKHQKHQDK